MFSCFLLTQLNVLIFMQIARLRTSQKLLRSLTNVIQYVNDECQKTTGRQIKFVHLVKLVSNRSASSSPESFEKTSNFESWGLTLAACKKGYWYNVASKNLFVISTPLLVETMIRLCFNSLIFYLVFFPFSLN